MHKNELKDLNVRQDTIKLLKENIGKTFSDINLTKAFSVQPLKVTNKSKHKPVGPNQTGKLLHSEGNQKGNKKTTCGMEKHSFKQCNGQGPDL